MHFKIMVASTAKLVTTRTLLEILYLELFKTLLALPMGLFVSETRVSLESTRDLMLPLEASSPQLDVSVNGTRERHGRKQTDIASAQQIVVATTFLVWRKSNTEASARVMRPTFKVALMK